MRGVVAAVGLAVLGAAADGCGSEQADYRNASRPPSPITVSAAIDQHRVRVSPKSFGAGPVTIIVSNQSGAAQRITFETDEVAGSSPGIRTSSGPVAPSDTTTLQADPREGTYRLGVGGHAIAPAAIVVGARRPSSQNQLLQP